MTMFEIKNVQDIIKGARVIEKGALSIMPKETYSIEDEHVKNVIKASFIKVGTDVTCLAELVLALAQKVQELETQQNSLAKK